MQEHLAAGTSGCRGGSHRVTTGSRSPSGGFDGSHLTVGDVLSSWGSLVAIVEGSLGLGGGFSVYWVSESCFKHLSAEVLFLMT